MLLRVAVLCLANVSWIVSSTALLDPTSKDNSADCECYLTSGPDAGYFQYHRFWDFRTISDDSDDIASSNYTVAPALVENGQNQGAEPMTSAYFNTTAWLRDWDIDSGPESSQAPVPFVDSLQNVYITRNNTNTSVNGTASKNTFLTLRASRLDSFMSTAQINSKQTNVLHSSIRARVRLLPSGSGNDSAVAMSTDNNATHPVEPGAVLGVFTYKSDKQESDIEFLTRDATDQVHYSNQPDYNAKTDSAVPGASTQVTLPDGIVMTEWADHRIDWFNGISRWYVNDMLVLEKKVNVPSQPSGLILNLWGDGGEWSGNMTVGGMVVAGVEWIDMVFNVSGSVKRESDLESRKENKCSVACHVDGLDAVGFPELAYNNSNGASQSMASSHASAWTSGTLFSILAGWILLECL